MAYRRYPEGAGGSLPGLLVISGLVLTLRAVLVFATGSVLLFLLQFPVANLALCILFAQLLPQSDLAVGRDLRGLSHRFGGPARG
jgi:hypothetical protein